MCKGQSRASFKTQNQFFVFQRPKNWHCASKTDTRVALILSWVNEKESPQPRDGGRIIMTKTKPPNLDATFKQFFKKNLPTSPKKILPVISSTKSDLA